VQNKKWYDYQAKTQKQLQKIELISQFINQYPTRKDIIVAQTKTAYAKEKAVYKTNLTNFITKNKNLWAAEMVANNPVYFPDPTEHPVAQDYNRRNNFWKNINTTNPKLLNTPIYTEHILNYLRFYMNPEMKFTETEMETGFKKSVDTIMQKFSGNEETKKFAIKYLQLGFKEIGQEKVLQYIDEKYQNEIKQCQDDIEKAEFEKRMAGYEALKQGTQAPEVFFDDKTGKIISLKDLPNNKTILAFWASWCPNCENQMPLLQDYISKNTNISAVAISLDDDKAAYETAIKKYPNLYHSCDFLKWKGKTVNDYYIYGSPTFIILDKDKKIIGKFPSWESALKELEIK
jgi:thiol-disulfide isomerase/thioredoxin